MTLFDRSVLLAASSFMLLAAGCSPSVSSPTVKQGGTLTQMEIIQTVDSGEFLGLSLDQLETMCGESQPPVNGTQGVYSRAIGICPGYGPDYRYLVAQIIDGIVTHVWLECS